ncbi:hypothetical protein M8J76_007799 [Diaphorina citri]|nr:hypothetical protein M8J76_007799 [Diaphorina citri]
MSLEPVLRNARDFRSPELCSTQQERGKEELKAKKKKKQRRNKSKEEEVIREPTLDVEPTRSTRRMYRNTGRQVQYATR